VPWLVLGATFLFVVQRPVMAMFARHHVPSAERDPSGRMTAAPSPSPNKIS
jgi:hypothetical protein